MNDLLRAYQLGLANSVELQIRISMGGTIPYRPRLNQLIVWIAASHPEQLLHSRVCPIPAILDTGFGGSVLVSERWLCDGIGLRLQPEFLVRTDYSLNTARGDIQCQLWNLDIYAYAQDHAPQPIPQLQSPQLLGCHGEEVFIIPNGSPAPPLPLLGMGLFRNRSLRLSVNAGSVRLEV